MKFSGYFSNILKRAISFFRKIEIKNLIIDSIEEDKEKDLIYLILRISGKCAPPIKKLPYELLMENGAKTSSLFSNNDFKLLISTMLENQEKLIKKRYTKIYSLINHRFSEQNSEPLLVYQNVITKQYYIKSAIEVFTDSILIQNFDCKDCACIGNIVGVYEAEKELTSHKIAVNVKLNKIIKFDNSALS